MGGFVLRWEDPRSDSDQLTAFPSRLQRALGQFQVI
jgi:hypothetical protein